MTMLPDEHEVMMIALRVTVFSILALMVGTSPLVADDPGKPIYVPTGDYDVIQLEGWTVYVDQRLKREQLYQYLPSPPRLRPRPLKFG